MSSGVNSLISGYTYGNEDGFSQDAWVAGAVSGAMFAAGLMAGGAIGSLALGANRFASASLFLGGMTVATLGGITSGFIKEGVYSSLVGSPYNSTRALGSAITYGLAATLAYFPSFIVSGLTHPSVVGALGSWSIAGVGVFGAYLTIVGEVVADIASYVVDNMTSIRPRFV